MEFLLPIIGIFLLEVVNSYCADNRGVAVVSKKEWKADIYDAISSTCTWLEGFLIFVEYKEFQFSIPSIIASVIGTHLAAKRVKIRFGWPPLYIKPRKPRIVRQKISFTSA